MTRSATAARASPARDGELHVLILEDVPVEAELTARALKQAGINALVKVVDTQESFTEELTESPPDLILSDYSLPGFDGEQALEIARTIAPEVPFIFVTGTLGEEHAVELMKQGAWDYVTKEHLSRLGLAVKRALKEVVDSRDREELRQREQAATTACDERARSAFVPSCRTAPTSSSPWMKMGSPPTAVLRQRASSASTRATSSG